jgi:hypothetical protein
VSDTYTLTAVGHVVGGREAVRDDDGGAERATVRLDRERFTADAVAGLDAFSRPRLGWSMVWHKMCYGPVHGFSRGTCTAR